MKTRFGAMILALSASGGIVLACPNCRPLVQAGIYGGDFALNFGLLMLPLALIVGAALAIYRLK